MRHTDGTLARLGRRAGSLLLSGALAASLTPALALANDGLSVGSALSGQSSLSATHYDPENKPGKTKAMIWDSGDPLQGGIKLVTADGNGKTYDEHTRIYMGYAHSDNGGHYQGYSLYTAMTVDDGGTLTAIDITSGNDTFAGKWGYSQKKSSKGNATPVNGYLPEGVTFKAVPNSDGTWTPVLGGIPSKTEIKDTTVTLMSVNAAGTKDSAGQGDSIVSDVYTGDVAKISTVKTTKTGEGESATTVEDKDYYNLVKVSYSLGNDKILFDTYFSVGKRADVADLYIDNVVEEADTTWDEDGTNDTNRDGWTAIMATMTLRQLGSWGATMKDPNTIKGLDGEIAAIDTVSGATKTATPFAAALNQARQEGFIKGVSENVKMTIDGNRKNALSINKSADDAADAFQDAVTVTKNDDNTYTLKGSFKPYGGGRLSLDALTAYNLKDVTLGAQGIMTLSKDLAKPDNAFIENIIWQKLPQNASSKNEKGLAFYDEDDESHIIAFGSRSTEGTDSFTVGGGRGSSASYEYKLSEDNVIQSSFVKTADATLNFEITIQKPEITHFAMTYTLGHGRITSVYDLANQAKVAEFSKTLAAATADSKESVTAAREAWDAVPYDVRPFVTGIDVLQQAEADLVAKQFETLDVNDTEAVKAALAAYDKLDANAKTKINTSGMSKITAAQQKYTIGSVAVTPASMAYTGKAQTPSVSVKAQDGSTVPAAGYSVAYANNTNAGKASVTVTAKGDYTGTAKATFTITKAAQTINAKAKISKKAKAKKKKLAKNTTYNIKSLAKVSAKTDVKYAKVGKTGGKKITVNAKTGKVTLKKGLKKATYKIKVKLTAAANANYNAAPAKTVTLTVKVK